MVDGVLHEGSWIGKCSKLMKKASIFFFGYHGCWISCLLHSFMKMELKWNVAKIHKTIWKTNETNLFMVFNHKWFCFMCFLYKVEFPETFLAKWLTGYYMREVELKIVVKPLNIVFYGFIINNFIKTISTFYTWHESWRLNSRPIRTLGAKD